MKNHREKTISGITWSAVGQIGTELSKFIVGILLMRMLGPDAFGIIGMVLVFTGLGNVVLEFGFAEALIQQKKVNHTDWSSIFWVNIGAGLLLGLSMFFLAPIIADFYEEPSIIPITRALSAIFLFQSLTIIQRTRLTKELKFKSLAQVDIAGFIGSGILAVIAAFSGLGVWSLVIQHLSRSMICGTYLFWLGKWTPSRIFSMESVRKAAGFSILMVLKRVLGHIAMNIDSMLIGKVLGKELLGLYNRAFFFMTLPVNSITNVIARVLFPSLSSIQDDLDEVRKVFKSMLAIVCFVVFPLMMGIFLLADPLVFLVFGKLWEPMIPFLRAFSILGMAATLTRLTYIPIMSLGRKDLLSKVVFIEKPLSIIAILIGLYWGIWGIIIAKLINSICIVFLKLTWSAESMEMSFWSLAKAIFPSLLTTLLTSIATYALQIFLFQAFVPSRSITFIILSTVSFILLYLGISLISSSKELKMLYKLVQSLYSKFIPSGQN